MPINPKHRHFAKLISFLRPLAQDTSLTNKQRVPISSILSETAIKHIMEFSDERIEEMNDDDKTDKWGNAFEFKGQ